MELDRISGSMYVRSLNVYVHAYESSQKPFLLWRFVWPSMKGVQSTMWFIVEEAPLEGTVRARDARSIREKWPHADALLVTVFDSTFQVVYPWHFRLFYRNDCLRNSSNRLFCSYVVTEKPCMYRIDLIQMLNQFLTVYQINFLTCPVLICRTGNHWKLIYKLYRY